MRKIFVLIIALLSLALTACGQESAKADSDAKAAVTAEAPKATAEAAKPAEAKTLAKLKFTVGDKVLYGTLEDNATTRELVKRLPLNVKMENLYSREMCYHLGAGELPTNNLRSDEYEVGDIIYWPPMGSFVIMYKQNGEQFRRQQLGRIEQGVEVFADGQDAQVKIEIVK